MSTGIVQGKSRQWKPVRSAAVTGVTGVTSLSPISPQEPPLVSRAPAAAVPTIPSPTSSPWGALPSPWLRLWLSPATPCIMEARMKTLQRTPPHTPAWKANPPPPTNSEGPHLLQPKPVYQNSCCADTSLFYRHPPPTPPQNTRIRPDSTPPTCLNSKVFIHPPSSFETAQVFILSRDSALCLIPASFRSTEPSAVPQGRPRLWAVQQDTMPVSRSSLGRCTLTPELLQNRSDPHQPPQPVQTDPPGRLSC